MSSRVTRLLTLLALIGGAQLASPQQTLGIFIDKNRVLLVFSPNAEDVRYRQQLALLQHHTAEMKDRDLILVPVLAEPSTPEPTPESATTHNALSTPEDRIVARNRFHVGPSDFTVLLLGKDGGEKLRSRKPLTMQTLDATIDAMPMRQDEIAKRSLR